MLVARKPDAASNSLAEKFQVHSKFPAAQVWNDPIVELFVWLGKSAFSPLAEGVSGALCLIYF